MLDIVAAPFYSLALHVKLIDSNPQDKTGQLLSFYNDILISSCQTNKGIINSVDNIKSKLLLCVIIKPTGSFELVGMFYCLLYKR